MNLRWTTWLWIWGAIAVLVAGAAVLLALQGAPTAARIVGYTGFALWAGWLGFGLWRWREVLWVARVSWFVIATVAAGLVAQIGMDMGWPGLVTVVVGGYLMAAAFILGLVAIRFALSPGHPITSVARTLVDEAVRMKVAVIFIVALVLMLPLIPVLTDGEQMLRYRLQTLLTWSMMATAVLLGLMTIFLSVATITNEVSNRQIFLTLTKPLGRGQYLAGKWLGIALLNLLLVGVCGGGIYVFTMLLAQQPAGDAYDARAVHQEVLTARRTVSPQPTDPEALQREFERQLRRGIELEPHRYGEPGATLTSQQRRERENLQSQIRRQWRTLDARERTTYVFDELAEAQRRGGEVQFRLKPEVGGQAEDGYVRMLMEVNGRRYQQTAERPLVELVAGTSHVLQIPTEVIEEGRLAITLHNVALPDPADPRREIEQPSINLSADDAMQLLYAVGTFEANLARALVLVWLHLCFLAALGLAAGTFLSFPSASLLSLTVYVIGATTGYIQSSLDSYAHMQEDLGALEKALALPMGVVEHLLGGEIGDALRMFVRMIGEAAMALVPSLSWFDPTTRIADGRIISVLVVGEGVLWMGVIWGGTAALIGWLIFRRRELAQVTV